MIGALGVVVGESRVSAWLLQMTSSFGSLKV
jgi:hypothetical protein